MYAFLQGKLFSKNAGEVVINCSGVGYLLNTSLRSFEQLPALDVDVFLYTYLIVREDSHQLYGFIDNQELELFKLLISISGVGPKVALGILSSITPSALSSSIMRNDIIQLQKLPGIGKKTAERLVLELKDKISRIDTGANNSVSNTESINSSVRDEAVSALIALGYNKTVAEKAVKQSELEFTQHASKTVEVLIRFALKNAMK